MNNLSFKNNTFFVGIDTHLKSWKVTIRNSGLELKTFSMNPSPAELYIYLTKHYPGATFNIVYEAGFCGFWPLRKFKELGLNCIIVNPADIPSSNKEKVVKTDPTDSRKLARELENNSLKPIYIPDIYTEQLRSLMRLRFQDPKQVVQIRNPKHEIRNKFKLPKYKIQNVGFMIHEFQPKW